MKVALVCDWLTNVGGAEKVLLEMHKLFPKAPIYTSKYDKKGINWFDDADVRTGWLQIFPSKLRRVLGPLRQKWFEKLDLSEYDLVISVTGAEAKAVKAPNGVHVSYCHVPTQYYWQMYDDYVENPGFGIFNPIVRCCFKLMVKPLKKADYKAAQGVDYFVTISEYAKGLIKKYYKRKSVVIHPPVEVEEFRVGGTKCSIEGPPEPGKARMSAPRPWQRAEATQPESEHWFQDPPYIATSRQVNWKRLDLAVKACLKLKRPLVVIGDGPEHKTLEKIAKGDENIHFLPTMGRDELAGYLREAKGYLFPSLEPFGIAPVEALAAGCPVIAFGEGGACDYVKDGKNGVLFEKQTVQSLTDAILKFEKMKFVRKKVAKSVEVFDTKRFDLEIKDFIKKGTKKC